MKISKSKRALRAHKILSLLLLTSLGFTGCFGTENPAKIPSDSSIDAELDPSTTSSESSTPAESSNPSEPKAPANFAPKSIENPTESSSRPATDSTGQSPASSQSSTPSEASSSAAEDAPSRKSIDLPFYAQAPFGNWDYPWQEACEEASLLLVANYRLGMNWSVGDFNQQILDLVDWEKTRFGGYEHTTAAQTLAMMQEKFSLTGRLRENPSFDDLVAAIDGSHLIIAPFAGQKLGNPYFSGEGPVYHMLVIHGYDKTGQKVITHDVGTRHGKNYEYSWDVISAALHDWSDTDILQGTKQWIEVN